MKSPTEIKAEDYTAHLRPGKFEGESAATEYFYEAMCNGDGDTLYGEFEVDSGIIFRITSGEADAFELPIGNWFLLREDSQGFAYGSVHATRGEAEAKFTAWVGGI